MTKILSKYDGVNDLFTAPTYAMNIATWLTQCCEIALTLYLTKKVPTISTAEVDMNLQNMIHIGNLKYQVKQQVILI